MIDPRQRYDDPEALLLVALGSLQARMWTSMPGIVQAFDATRSTVDVQLAISGAVQAKDGTTQAQPYTLLKGLPIVWPHGGNCTLTFPVAAGDECLVVFAARAIDFWWKYGGTNQPPAESRMHSLADGFAILGPFSQAQKLANVSTSTVQLRSNDGQAKVELDPTGHVVSITAPGGIHFIGPVTITGAMTVSQTISASQNITSSTDIKVGSISLAHHVHAGVQSGGSTTAGPQ